MFVLTDSPWLLGLLGFAFALPAIVFVLVGGVLADKFDRRRIIISTQVTLAGLVFILALLTSLGSIEAWHLVAISAFVGAAEGLGRPSRHAFYPGLIDRKAIVSAVTMLSPTFSVAAVGATTAAGVLFSSFGPALSFYVSSTLFLIMAGFVYRLRPLPIRRETQSLLEGLRSIDGIHTFSFLVVMSFISVVFGAGYFILMPILVRDFLILGTETQGWLAIFVSIGGY